MKYETMVKLHEAYYWSIWSWDYQFTPKDKYTIYDFIHYLPVYVCGKIIARMCDLWDHRPQIIVAKKPQTNSDNQSRSEKP